MIKDNVNIVFNKNTDPKNFDKLDKDFVALIFGFFKSEKIVEIFVNSTHRKMSPTDKSFHAFGQALDLHYVKYENGKVIYFSIREDKYNSKDEIAFSERFNSYFNNYRIEYFSPSKIISVWTNTKNKYSGKTKAVQNAKLAEKKKGAIADLDRDHLDHGHLAIAPNKLAKPRAILKSILPAVAMIFFFMRF
jgi:hypothetical protein